MTPAASPTFEVDSDGIGWITFSDPDRPLNVLGEAVMLRFGETLDEARAAAREGRAKVVVVRSGKPDSFIAGADVDAIASIEDPGEAETKIRLGQAIFNDVAALPVPTVAAIHGLCVGGGVELALACDHRVLSDSKKPTLQMTSRRSSICAAGRASCTRGRGTWPSTCFDFGRMDLIKRLQAVSTHFPRG